MCIITLQKKEAVSARSGRSALPDEKKKKKKNPSRVLGEFFRFTVSKSRSPSDLVFFFLHRPFVGRERERESMLMKPAGYVDTHLPPGQLRLTQPCTAPFALCSVALISKHIGLVQVHGTYIGRDIVSHHHRGNPRSRLQEYQRRRARACAPFGRCIQCSYPTFLEDG